jgi:hypothetical protein
MPVGYDCGWPLIAIDFCVLTSKYLLDKNLPEKRYKLPEILAHNWAIFRQNTEFSAKSSLSIKSKKTLTNLVDF